MGLPNAQQFPPPDVGGEDEVVASLIVEDLTASRVVYTDTDKRLTSTPDLIYAAGTDDIILAKVTGDATYRFKLEADGAMEYGDGASAYDVKTYRASTNTWAVRVGSTDVLSVGGTDAVVISRPGNSSGAVGLGLSVSTGAVTNIIAGTTVSALISLGGGNLTWQGAGPSFVRTLAVSSPVLAASAPTTVDYAYGIVASAPSAGLNITITTRAAFVAETGGTGYGLWTDGSLGFAVDNAVDLTPSTQRPRDVFIGRNLTVGSLTSGRIPYASTGGLLVDDSGLTFNGTTDSIALAGFINIGTTTDAAAAGDLGAGLTGASRLFWDQSAPSLKVFNGATENVELTVSAVGRASINPSGGRVGINTATIGAALEVVSTTLGQLRASYTANTVFTEFLTASDGNLYLTTTGTSVRFHQHLLFQTDNTYDIGAAGATRARTIYAGTSINTPSVTVASSDLTISTTTSGSIILTPSSWVVEQRNGSGNQTFNLYNTTDGTNKEYLSLLFSGNEAYIQTNQAGTGTGRPLNIRTQAGAITFATAFTTRWTVSGTAGHLLAGTDNTYDVGATGATRPRTVYAGTSVITGDGSAASPGFAFASQTGTGMFYPGTLGLLDFATAGGLRMRLDGGSALYLFNNSSGIFFGASSDAVLRWDAANAIAQRNGTAGQSFRLYNTYTDSSNYERAAFWWTGNFGYIGTENAGTGSARPLVIYSAETLYFETGGRTNTRWNMQSTGHFIAQTDNTYDLGGTSNRVRTGYFATQLNVGTTTFSSFGRTLTLESAAPGFGFYETGAAVDEKAWDLYIDNGILNLRWINDAITVGTRIITVDRTAHTAGVITLNEDASDIDLRIESPADQYMFFVDAGNSRVGIRNSAPSVLLHVGIGGGVQGYLRLESAGAVSREANLYSPSAGGLTIDTNSNSYPIEFNGSEVRLWPGASNGWTVNSSRHLVASTDNTYDLGASLATRPRTGYFGTSIIIGPAESTTVSGQLYLFAAGNTFAVIRDATNDVETIVGATSTGAVVGSVTSHSLLFRTVNTNRWEIGSGGSMYASTDNSYDLGAAGLLRPRTGYFGTSLVVGTNPAATGIIRLQNAQAINWRNAANSSDIQGIYVNASDYVVVGGSGRILLDPSTGDIQWGKALVALGGGAAATLGTIGGSGPATAAQNTWMRLLDSTGAAFWVPAWK